MCSNQYVEDMYKGEELRDASSKLRGYIFQDILAVELLLESQDENNELYVEWAEDLYMEGKDEIVIVQAKYSSSNHGTIDYLEVYGDLYYQYLRLKVLGCTKNTKFKLSCYNNGNMTKRCSLVQMQENIRKPCANTTCNKSLMDKAWLENVVYNNGGKKRNKECRENIVLFCIGTDELSEKFFENFEEDIRESDIKEFREDVKQKIKSFLEGKNLFQNLYFWDEKTLLDVCYAKSMEYIRNAYEKNNSTVSERKRTLAELLDIFKNILTNGMTEDNLIILLNLYMDEVFQDNILEDRSLAFNDEATEEAKSLYHKIYESTKQYFLRSLNEIGNQQRLYNTISLNKCTDGYSQKSIKERLDLWRETKDKFKGFIRNVWKILFDLNCSNFEQYIEEECKEYLQFRFEKSGDKKYVVLSETSRSENKKI